MCLRFPDFNSVVVEKQEIEFVFFGRKVIKCSTCMELMAYELGIV